MSAAESETRVDSSDFVEALNHFTTGVAIVTTSNGDRLAGATVAAVSALSAEPPMLFLSMSLTSATAAAISESGVFALNILDEDQATVAGRFASREANKFAGLGYELDAAGCPLLQGVIAGLSCHVVVRSEVGSHVEFHAVVDAVRLQAGQPLAYFRGSFARLHTAADDAVLRSVRSRVLALRTEHEERLDPEDLASQLDVSRGFVLRALSALATESLIERRDGVYYVSAVPDHVVDAVYRAKLVIELGVAVQSVGRIDAAQLEELRTRLERRRKAAEGLTPDRLDDFLQASNDFQEYLVGFAGSPSLLTAYRSLGLSGIDRRTMTAGILAQLPRADSYQRIADGFEAEDLPAVVAALQSEQREPRWMREQAAALAADL